MAKHILGTLLSTCLLLSPFVAQADQNYFEGKIISIENDGNAWIEVDPAFHKSFVQFSEHMFQDNLYRPYDIFKFHFHGIDLGLENIQQTDPHAQTSFYAVSEMRKSLKGKRAKILCLDTTVKKMLASCISDVEGKDISLENLRAGYAQTHITDATPQDYAANLAKAEDQAKEANRGIWSSTLGLFSKSL